MADEKKQQPPPPPAPAPTKPVPKRALREPNKSFLNARIGSDLFSNLPGFVGVCHPTAGQPRAPSFA